MAGDGRVVLSDAVGDGPDDRRDLQGRGGEIRLCPPRARARDQARRQGEGSPPSGRAIESSQSQSAAACGAVAGAISSNTSKA